MWSAANFRLEISGLDCTGVTKIDSFTVKQAFATDQLGDSRLPQTTPTNVDFPNLHVKLTFASGQSWMDWFDDFVIKGNNGQEKEKSGSLTYLTEDRQRELARVDFFNMGIFKLTDDPQPDDTDGFLHLTAELYCERMELSIIGGAGGKPGPTPPPNTAP